MSLEPELKFRAERRKLSRLVNVRLVGARSGKCSETNLRSTYFDTKKHKLRRHGLTLRVRQADGSYIQTIKAVATRSFARGEWESKLEHPSPDLAKANNTPLERLASKKLGRNLKPVFRTSVRRITRPFYIGDSQIELAIDRGNVSAKQRSAPIAEFELELKCGRATNLFHIAKLLERKIGAQLDLRSKSEQGYFLANGSKEVATHAEPIQLDKKLTSHEAFGVIALSSLRHFSANADAVRALDAEAIHQMRVGLRRLRAAISLFKKVLPNAGTAKIKTELKWLTGQLAPAREIDVFLKERVRPIVSKNKPKRGARAIRSQFSAKRIAAFKDARNAVEMPRFRRLLIETLEWLETRKPVRDDNTQTSIEQFAADVLDRRIRKARKQGRRLKELSAEERHKLRIKIKKIRYALEFFESLYADKDRKQLARLEARLKKIQSALGALNDAIAHEGMARKAALAAPRQNTRARAFTSGILVGQEREAAKGLVQAAYRELRKLYPPTVEPA